MAVMPFLMAFRVNLSLSTLLGRSPRNVLSILFQFVFTHISRPSGFMEFDITEAMRNWQNGDPNYGVLLMATKENGIGRDIRFYSNAETDTSRHAYVNVLCD